MAPCGLLHIDTLRIRRGGEGAVPRPLTRGKSSAGWRDVTNGLHTSLWLLGGGVLRQPVLRPPEAVCMVYRGMLLTVNPVPVSRRFHVRCRLKEALRRADKGAVATETVTSLLVRLLWERQSSWSSAPPKATPPTEHHTPPSKATAKKTTVLQTIYGESLSTHHALGAPIS